ncbi:ABC-F family ATP-binding cassette domain-containing protein [bacterium]|jgi:ABC transport system ATP-binding/permease protein|nr:ABC-F family ATP-binding cassette domain-containing protein [bacterium]
MSLLSVNQLTCVQVIKTLFEDATFSVNEKDKIAVVGPNGCGKTTLLSILAKSVETPNDNISVRTGLRLTSLDQNPEMDPEHSILEHLYRSPTTASLAIKDYHDQVQRYNLDQSDEIEKAFTAASEKMDHLNLWEYEDRVNSILRELHIDDLNQKMKDLSGGMRKKIALAQLFFDETEVLVLDEPTNHLDINTIEWLEGMLKKQNSAIVMVTHDRYFLDNVCTKIIEIDQQEVFVYEGNYQTYLEQRAQRYAAQEKQESRVQSVLRVELEWLKRGPKARSTKQKARKDRISTMMDRKGLDVSEALSLNVTERRMGKKILELKNVTKSFGDKLVVSDFSHVFEKGEKIGILGPNGAGKSTFLNLIMDKLTPDSGEVDPGVNTVFGYFDQHSKDFDPEISIFEHVSEIGTQFIAHDGTKLSASKLLERFLFPSSMLKTLIGKLSGGERRRLHLVCLLLSNPNFLLFDEPTNDLDIQTLSVLEDFLLNFTGCVIIISHDRYFMDRVVDNLLVFSIHGQIDRFQGNYTDYIDTMKVIESLKKKTSSVKETVSTPPKQANGKLSNREKEEMSRLEKEMEGFESEKASLAKVFTNPSSNDANFEDAGRQIKEIDDQLAKSMTRWEALVEKE